MKDGYLVIDIGTGNIKAGVYLSNGDISSSFSCEAVYTNDERDKDAHSFDPRHMWEQICDAARKVIFQSPDVSIRAVVPISARHGIVLLDKEGEPFLGLPNIDNRGACFEGNVPGEANAYDIAGRSPARYFAAYKLLGLKQGKPEKFSRISKVLSLSDWVGYQLVARCVFEAGQAAETLLYDVRNNCWSDELCYIYGISPSILPEIVYSGDLLGYICPDVASALGLPEGVPCIVGGADTQIGVAGTQADDGIPVIISGTTTPIALLTSSYFHDEKKGCWIDPYINKNQYLIEVNAGVTGLNYQRLKNMMFPEISYAEIEQPFLGLPAPNCICSFTTMDFCENLPFLNGAYLFRTPLPAELKKADFAYALLIDIACSIARNIRNLEIKTKASVKEIVGCGGGFQSEVLCNLVSSFTSKPLKLKKNFFQATSMGGVYLGNRFFGDEDDILPVIKEIEPRDIGWFPEIFNQWKALQLNIN